MSEKIRSQILDIRNSGTVNMFSVNEVQRLAFEKDYHELVLFILHSDGRDAQGRVAENPHTRNTICPGLCLCILANY